jgi:hypothetical protein
LVGKKLSRKLEEAFMLIIRLILFIVLHATKPIPMKMSSCIIKRVSLILRPSTSSVKKELQILITPFKLQKKERVNLVKLKSPD